MIKIYGSGGFSCFEFNYYLYRKIVEATNGEFNIWENNTDFYSIPNELCEVINKIKSGNYWFISGYNGVYGKLQIGQIINHVSLGFH